MASSDLMCAHRQTHYLLERDSSLLKVCQLGGPSCSSKRLAIERIKVCY